MTWRTQAAPVVDWQKPVWAVREPVAAVAVAEPVASTESPEQTIATLIGIAPANLATNRGVALQDLVACAMHVVRTFAEIRGLRLAMEADDVTRANRQELRRKIDYLDLALRKAVTDLSRDRSKPGRALNLLAITGTVSADPADWVDRASRMLGGRKLPEVDADAFVQAMDAKEWKRARSIIDRLAKGPA